jgi:hypothetical protein
LTLIPLRTARGSLTQFKAGAIRIASPRGRGSATYFAACALIDRGCLSRAFFRQDADNGVLRDRLCDYNAGR